MESGEPFRGYRIGYECMPNQPWYPLKRQQDGSHGLRPFVSVFAQLPWIQTHRRLILKEMTNG
jgi:hypothetical protein